MTLSPRTLRDLSLLFVCLLIFGWGVWTLTPPRQNRIILRMSAGSSLGTRHALALQLKDICRAHKIEIEIIPTDGSDQALREVSDGNIDLAFAQGGLIGQHYPHVTQVAPLHLEPLHLLVKSEVSALMKSQGLAVLGGRVINTGTTGSGTQALARLVLKFLGLHSSAAAVTQLSLVGPWAQSLCRESTEL